MKIQKKHVIIGSLFLVSSAAALAYWQYTKLMNYCIGFKSLKVKALTPALFNFDIFLNFQNKSDIKFTIQSQEYSVYLNGAFVTKIKNLQSDEVPAKSSKIMGLNVQFNPKSALSTVKLNAVDLLTHPDKVKIKIDSKLKVKLWFFTVDIPYIYEASLKELMTPSPVNEADPNANKC